MYSIVNIDDLEILATDSAGEFVSFANRIANENEDFVDLRTIAQARDYINDFCDNLTLTIK